MRKRRPRKSPARNSRCWRPATRWRCRPPASWRTRSWNSCPLCLHKIAKDLPNSAVLRSVRLSHRLLKLQNELVDLHRRAEDERIAGIVGIAQEVRIGHELESGSLDFGPQGRFGDPVIGLADGRSVLRSRRMIRHDEQASG